MTFEEAIKLAIRKYYEGEDPVELMGSQEGEMKYTREYFDELEEEMVPSKKGKKKGKGKKKADTEEFREELEEYEFD
jgi:hypothetical protein